MLCILYIHFFFHVKKKTNPNNCEFIFKIKENIEIFRKLYRNQIIILYILYRPTFEKNICLHMIKI